MATDVCVTSEVRLAVVVLSVDADGCLYRRWCVTSDGVSPHGVAPRGVAPRGVSRAATPRTAAPVLRGAGSTWFFPAWCTAVRSDASAALLRTCAEDPFRPGLRLRQDRCCQKALFTREKLYQSRSHVQGAPVSATDSPPGSLCSNPYNLHSGSPANLPAALSLLSASTLWLSAAGAGTTAWRHVWVATAVLRDRRL